MNKKLREYLIDIAREFPDKMIYYSDVVRDCNLEINLNSEYGGAQIGKLLGEISEFEFNQGRRMLSSLVIRMDDHRHGKGFYTLASQLLNKSVKELERMEYGFMEANECRNYWRDDKNYHKFRSIHLNNEYTIVDLYNELIDNCEWAEDWSYPYISFVKEIQKLKTKLKSNTYNPIDDDSLYKDLDKDINTYRKFLTKWLKERDNKISSRGQSVLSNESFNYLLSDPAFKMSFRETILNPSIDTYNALDKWWRNNDELYNRPLLINRAFASCLPTQLTSTVHYPKFIKVIQYLKNNFNYSYDESNRNWYSLNIDLTAWLDVELKPELEKYKDETERVVWRNIFVWLVYENTNSGSKIVPNRLTPIDRPTGFDKIPVRNRVIASGNPNPDYLAQARLLKDLGDAGELLVLETEKKKLIDLGFSDLAEQVVKVPDYKGFDILSYDKDKNEIHIEVKTTTAGSDTPFYLSENELDFLINNPNRYCLYRICNYNDEHNTGDIFIINDVENQILKEPTNYRVYIKKST